MTRFLFLLCLVVAAAVGCVAMGHVVAPLLPEWPPVNLAIAPFIIPAITSIASLLGGIFGNKKRTQPSSTVPTLDPAFGGLQGLLMKQIMARLTNPSKLPTGYEAGAISGINNTYGLAQQSLDNRLTARGLGTSPIAGAGETNMQLGRAGEISRMQAGLPLIERQLQDQDLVSAQRLLGLGRGQTTTQTTPSNMVAGGLGSLSSMLAFLYGNGAFGGGTAAGNPLAAAPLPGGNVQWKLPTAPGSTWPW